MTVPAYDAVSGGIYNVIISPSGQVQVQWISGPAPGASTNITLNSEYGITTPLAYAPGPGYHGSFTDACPPGEVGPTITFTVPPYMFIGPDQTTVNNEAAAYLQTAGQQAANQQTCYVQTSCSFTWASSLAALAGPGTVTETDGVVTFNFVFYGNSTSYTGGTVGTISGSCVPASPKSILVTNQSDGSKWTVSISTSGVVTCQEGQGNPENGTNPPPLQLSGTYSVN